MRDWARVRQANEYAGVSQKTFRYWLDRVTRTPFTALIYKLLYRSVIKGRYLWAGEKQGRVVGVTAGDTLKVLVDRQETRIRLYGIDCPKKKQAFCKKANQFTSCLAANKYITLKTYEKDRYGRTIGDAILPDGRNLNHEIVRVGFGWWYRKYAPDNRILKKLEAEAKVNRRGLWVNKSPVPPWEWRKQPPKED